MSITRKSIQEALGRRAVHPFPARMAVGIALETLADMRRPAVILDPMAGSGTVLAIARANGHRAIGFDVDPLAVLISRVWTRTIDREEITSYAITTLMYAKSISKEMKLRNAYPVSADSETRQFIRYWFDDYSRKQLASLAVAISEIDDKEVQETLWCAFSRLIITKQSGVSLALDLAHSRPHRAFELSPIKPFTSFIDAVDKVVAGCVTRTARDRGPVASMQLGDVRDIPLSDQTVDLVFTSPPYLNAIDYLRCSKFSLVWMGYSVSAIRSIRASSIGTELGSNDENEDEVLRHLRLRPALSSRMRAILRRYVDDTNCAVKEVARVLVLGGKAVYVVGENTIRGTFIPTAHIVACLAERAGLQLENRKRRSLPENRRYLPPPTRGSNALDTRIRREVVLTFKKRQKSSRCVAN